MPVGEELHEVEPASFTQPLRRRVVVQRPGRPERPSRAPLWDEAVVDRDGTVRVRE